LLIVRIFAASKYYDNLIIRMTTIMAAGCFTLKNIDLVVHMEKARKNFLAFIYLAPGAGLEPAAWWLTATRSTD
jgi:hypothetical protein